MVIHYVSISFGGWNGSGGPHWIYGHVCRRRFYLPSWWRWNRPAFGWTPFVWARWEPFLKATHIDASPPVAAINPRTQGTET